MYKNYKLEIVQILIEKLDVSLYLYKVNAWTNQDGKTTSQKEKMLVICTQHLTSVL